jgi:hypothetical protein
MATDQRAILKFARWVPMLIFTRSLTFTIISVVRAVVSPPRSKISEQPEVPEECRWGGVGGSQDSRVEVALEFVEGGQCW